MRAMSSEKGRLEIGHVLFIDIVGYSKLLLKQQSELQRELNEIVSGTSEFRQADSAGKLIRLPTGDGMALVFRTSPEAPAECAIEIARTLKSHPAIQLRMGIHSGPVNEVADVNQRANVAGAGINIAQRVMDCGDAGHILLSRHSAEDLEQDDRWRSLLLRSRAYDFDGSVNSSRREQSQTGDRLEAALELRSRADHSPTRALDNMDERAPMSTRALPRLSCADRINGR